MTQRERIINPSCDSCGVRNFGFHGDLRSDGWAFDVDGNDLCPRCSPYNERTAADGSRKLKELLIGMAVIAVAMAFVFYVFALIISGVQK